VDWIMCGPPGMVPSPGDRAEVARFAEFLRLVETETGRELMSSDPGWVAWLGLPGGPGPDGLTGQAKARKEETG
jgi:hypothetical protein